MLVLFLQRSSYRLLVLKVLLSFRHPKLNQLKPDAEPSERGAVINIDLSFPNCSIGSSFSFLLCHSCNASLANADPSNDHPSKAKGEGDDEMDDEDEDEDFEGADDATIFACPRVCTLDLLHYRKSNYDRRSDSS
jgi:hypothetical protein